jgi:hypothetical protein
MNDPEEKVALQAIEFWSTVCDVEMEIKEEIADVSISRYSITDSVDRELMLAPLLPSILGPRNWRTTRTSMLQLCWPISQPKHPCPIMASHQTRRR